MIILLIIYFVFLLAFIAFNLYAIFKVWSLRWTKDKTQPILIGYAAILAVIIIISLIIISGLDWSTNFQLVL